MGISMKQSELIKILSVGDVPFIKKPWGWERWIADGRPHFPYVFKEIFLKAGFRSSLQFHRKKQETSYVQKGKGILHYCARPVDVERFLAGGYSEDELSNIVRQLEKKELKVGSVYHISPGIIHRLEAIEDIMFVESSTVEVDDIFRLADDQGRGHGRIDKEHQLRK